MDGSPPRGAAPGAVGASATTTSIASPIMRSAAHSIRPKALGWCSRAGATARTIERARRARSSSPVSRAKALENVGADRVRRRRGVVDEPARPRDGAIVLVGRVDERPGLVVPEVADRRLDQPPGEQRAARHRRAPRARRAARRRRRGSPRRTRASRRAHRGPCARGDRRRARAGPRRRRRACAVASRYGSSPSTSAPWAKARSASPFQDAICFSSRAGRVRPARAASSAAAPALDELGARIRRRRRGGRSFPPSCPRSVTPQ